MGDNCFFLSIFGDNRTLIWLFPYKETFYLSNTANLLFFIFYSPGFSSSLSEFNTFLLFSAVELEKRLESLSFFTLSRKELIFIGRGIIWVELCNSPFLSSLTKNRADFECSIDKLLWLMMSLFASDYCLMSCTMNIFWDGKTGSFLFFDLLRCFFSSSLVFIKRSRIMRLPWGFYLFVAVYCIIIKLVIRTLDRPHPISFPHHRSWNSYELFHALVMPGF